jgi:hypothetical protein
MVERKYIVEEGKYVTVNLYVMQSTPTQLVIEIKGDKETITKYLDEDSIAFAINIDDVLDAIREALSPSKVVRD